MWCDSLQPKESLMGAPSREQIDECIADGLARRLSERQILKDLLTLERMTRSLRRSASFRRPTKVTYRRKPTSPIFLVQE